MQIPDSKQLKIEVWKQIKSLITTLNCSMYYGYIFARSGGLSIQLAMHELGGPLVAEGRQAAA